MANKPDNLVNNATDEEDIDSDYLLEYAVLRLNGSILGIVLGIIIALFIFAATNWLVIKGGNSVGPHLNLLGQFFFGYSVTFIGSLIGAFYGFLTGFISGFLIAWIYNKIIILRERRR